MQGLYKGLGMTKPVWSHVLALSAWNLKIAHMINKR